MFSKDDESGMATLVRSVYDNWLRGEHVLNKNVDRITKFSRAETARELAGIIKQIAGLSTGADPSSRSR
jgi:hypothetical protein